MIETALGWDTAVLGDLGQQVRRSVTPQAGKDYEVWSVPAFANSLPERLEGSSIGSAKLSVEPGDVLICKINPRINRVWQVTDTGSGLPRLASPEWLVFRPSVCLDPTYAQHLLSAPRFREYITDAVSGVTGSHTRAKADHVLRFELPLPPLDEQRRIVAILEEHLSRLDAATASLAEARKRLDALYETSAAALFGSIAEWQVLSKVADVRLGRQRSPKNHSGPGMRPYLRAANVTWSGLALDDVKVMSFTEAEMEVYRLRSGDILLSEASGSATEVGKPAMWRDELLDCAFQNTLLRVRAHKVGSHFLLHYFRFLARSGHFAKASRGVGIHHLGRAALAALKVPCPSTSIQESITMSLDEVAVALARIDAAIEVGARRSESLRRSLMGAAFSGQLAKESSVV